MGMGGMPMPGMPGGANGLVGPAMGMGGMPMPGMPGGGMDMGMGGMPKNGMPGGDPGYGHGWNGLECPNNGPKNGLGGMA